MRAVIQRVNYAAVKIDGIQHSAIDNGFVILLGIENADTSDDIDWLCHKIINLRIFDDENLVMNKSILETGGEILLVSQFTLMASIKKGNRPSYIRASPPMHAKPIYEKTISTLNFLINKPIKTGKFGANMQIELCNHGPVTILIDTKNKE